MASFRDYLQVSQRGYFTTRVLTRPVASLLLSIIPKKLEKYISPNKISFSAFIVAQFSNLILSFQLLEKSYSFTKIMFIWISTQYLAYVLDCADGQFARQMKQTSNEGKILDMILDLAREIMRLLFFAYFLIELEHGFLVIMYLGFRAYWMSTWAPIHYLDSLSNPDKTQTLDNFRSKNPLRIKFKNSLLFIFSLPQDGFIDIFTCAILFAWTYSGNTNRGLGYCLLIFLFFSILINISLVFRRILR